MRLVLTTLAALAIGGAAIAQTPPAKPAPAVDEDLALAALEGLMQQSSDRALPIIKKVLAGSQTATVKRRALFVLSQIDAPEARQILLQTARSTDAGMRGEAIRSIGIGGDAQTLDALIEVYRSGNSDVQKEVLQAWMIAGRKDAVFQIAMNAKSEDEANAAIHMLGVMGATEELRKLGERPNAARGLVEAYALSGDLASLRKMAESSPDRATRLEAVRKMGIVDGEQAHLALREIYARATDADVREAALQGMMMSSDEQGVLALYRASRSSEEKRMLLRYLSMMGGDAALQAIDQALEGKK